MNTPAVSRRQVLATLPALAVASRSWAQTSVKAPLAAKCFNHFMLSVKDVQRSVDFYQGLFGMPIQARHGVRVLLRVGEGPQYLSIEPAGDKPPSIGLAGLAIENFDAARALKALTDFGLTKLDAGHHNQAGEPRTARMFRRGNSREVYLTDPDGLLLQIQDARYCGGSGEMGSICNAVEPSSKKGLMAVKDWNHATIQVSDAERTIDFYRSLFGIHVQGHQAPPGSNAAPFHGLGTSRQFVMFLGTPRREGIATASRPARIDHVCLSMDGFDPEVVTKTLNGYGIKSQAQGEARGPMMTYITQRMPNRGGAEGGTPELYFIDPDGLSIQLQDSKYCGGSGFLGDVCA